MCEWGGVSAVDIKVCGWSRYGEEWACGWLGGMVGNQYLFVGSLADHTTGMAWRD